MTLLYVLIIICICAGLTFIINGLINKFCDEDVLIEKYEEEHKEEIQSANKKELKAHKNEIKKLKSKFVPKFDFLVFGVLAIMEIAIFLFICNKSIEQFIIYSFLNCCLVICTFTDIKRCIIPDEVNFCALIIGLVFCFYKICTSFKLGIDFLLGGVIGFAIFTSIYFFSLLVFKKEGMGGGDIKLVGVLGLFFGIKSIIQIFVLSFFIASIISVFLLVSKIKKKDDYIPFGPYIVAATYITMFITGAYTYNKLYRLMIYGMWI